MRAQHCHACGVFTYRTKAPISQYTKYNYRYIVSTCIYILYNNIDVNHNWYGYIVRRTYMLSLSQVKYIVLSACNDIPNSVSTNAITFMTTNCHFNKEI